ncbi:hypothetical protein N7466_004730 [Penicillium verhagenii]|uniref:uncharacterized protein n=1 Tax=Penicillium verhagenii TaxID=1562060 RepID=UPI002544FAE8|nr:uncharacterized protein N7466_004730 [Penicillium verhagenii]KAJ5935183.1 hypothetical protein N7466_004730 [Penicillium verhagenii]
MPSLKPRIYCDSWDDDCSNSSWNSWGRWVAFAVIVAIAFLIFFAFACFNARRRRSHGQQPYTGTSWMAPPPGPPPPHESGYQQPYYPNNNDPYFQHQPPPQYSANPQNYGYFGAQAPPHQQQNGIELQAPQNAYNASGARDYAPPTGPPPAKK